MRLRLLRLEHADKRSMPELYGDAWTDADLAPATETAPVQESF